MDWKEVNGGAIYNGLIKAMIYGGAIFNGLNRPRCQEWQNAPGVVIFYLNITNKLQSENPCVIPDIKILII